MSRRRFILPPDPIPASPLCQVVTGDNGGCEREGCDCMHEAFVRRRKTLPCGLGRRTVSVRVWWYVCVDNFTGIAVTYFPVATEEPTRELITEPELARLLR